MGTVSSCDKTAQNETLTMDHETSELLRQYQQKTGLDLDVLVKRAVEILYRDIEE